MRWQRRHIPWRSLARKPAAVIALLAYCVTALGLSVPLPTEKDHSRPYPCMGHACGCRSAEQCWRHCCCFSPEEKLAWAEAHGVSPPPYAEQPSAPGWQTVRRQDREAGHDCAACSPHLEANRLACCGGTASARPCSHPSSRRPAEGSRPQTPSRSGWVLSMAALRCQGLNPWWVGVGPATPPPPPLTWTPCWPPAGWLFSADASVHVLAQTPPDPPPRSADA
jgi:hypothetical protein